MNNANMLALRAITAEFGRRIFVKIGVIAGAVLAVLLVGIVALAVLVSHWWLLTLLVLVPVGVVGGVILLLLRHALANITPRKLSTEEKSAARRITDTITGYTEKVGTPLPVLAVQVGKDILRQRESTYVKGIIDETKTLRNDFVLLRDTFSERN